MIEAEHDRLMGEFNDDDDPSFNAQWAAKLGEVAVRAGDSARATGWLSVGAEKDPQNRWLEVLDRRLNDSCCNDLRVELEPIRRASDGYRRDLRLLPASPIVPP